MRHHACSPENAASGRDKGSVMELPSCPSSTSVNPSASASGIGRSAGWLDGFAGEVARALLTAHRAAEFPKFEGADDLADPEIDDDPDHHEGEQR